MVLVLVSGRPLVLGAALEQADAVVAAWLPGSEGAGVADVLFGEAGFTGKLGHSWPRSVAQIPINVGGADYRPLFPYGSGLTTPGPQRGHAERHGEHAAGHVHDFSDVDHYVKRFEAPERAAWQKPEEVVRLLDVPPSGLIVDLGAGTGYFLPYLAKAAANTQTRILALDVAPPMVEFMRKRVAEEKLERVEVRQVPPESPELQPKSVRRLLIVDTWHHLPNRRAYAQALAQALDPADGALMIVEYTKDAPDGPPAELRLDPKTVMDELSSAGLAVERVDESLPRQYVIRARRASQ